MEVLSKAMVLALALLFTGCSSTTKVEQEKVDNVFIKVEGVSELKMRKVEVTVLDDGSIIISPKYYENLSKNMSDIYRNYRLLKEHKAFYESQMFDK